MKQHVIKTNLFHVLVNHLVIHCAAKKIGPSRKKVSDRKYKSINLLSVNV